MPGDSPQSPGETRSLARMIDVRYMPTPRVPTRSPTSETIMLMYQVWGSLPESRWWPKQFSDATRARKTERC